LNWCSSF